MSVQALLLALQWAQLKHDEAYHKDIAVMPLVQRVKHMTLHNAKYTAYFLDAAETHDAARAQQVLIDAFIIVMVIANILNQDLGAEANNYAGTTSLHDLGSKIAANLRRDPNDPLWIIRQFTRNNGRLAKLCESWDHLEAIPFREGMTEANRELFRTVLAEASARDIDLEHGYRLRLQSIEARSIFDSHLRDNVEGRK